MMYDIRAMASGIVLNMTSREGSKTTEKFLGSID